VNQEKGYVYIFVRQDMSISQQLVQAVHAAHESGLAHQTPQHPSSVILFGTKNQEDLEKCLDKYKKELNCYPFYEPYKNIGLTAFATEPISEDQRKLFKQYQLWKPQELL
jgi:hypothetical protein